MCERRANDGIINAKESQVLETASIGTFSQSALHDMEDEAKSVDQESWTMACIITRVRRHLGLPLYSHGALFLLQVCP